MPLLKRLWLGLGISGHFLLPHNADAVAFRLPNQDPEAIARGNAFAATADNPSAIYYNPAGITQMEGHNLNIGLYLISSGVEFESPGGADAKTRKNFQPVPQVYYVISPKDSRLSLGLGIYAPYGLALDWGDNPPFRTVAQEGKLLYASINPVAAWQIHPTLSVGVGPTINYSKVEFKRGIGFLPKDKFEFDGEDFDYGFNAGVLWQPHSKWSFGVNYRFPTTLKYRGKSQARPYSKLTGTSAELRFPQFVVGGISFRPTTNWNLEVNIDWTDWDNVNEVVFKGTAAGDVVLPLNYRSSLMYEFGITRKLWDGYFVSVGYFFSENSIPDRTFNPIVPDSDLHLGSVGFGRRGERWNWAAAFHFGYNSGRRVNDSVFGPSVEGTYRAFNPAFTASATYKF